MTAVILCTAIAGLLVGGASVLALAKARQARAIFYFHEQE